MKLAVMAGDGIGPEVMNEALKVLNTLSSLDSTLQLEMEELPWSSAYYMETGRMMPADALSYLQHFDAILFGAIGDARVPDEVTIWDLIMPIRKEFQQYVNVRPVKQLKGVASPLDTKAPIDFVVFRENAEGEYSHMGGRMYGQTSQEMAVQTTVMTKAGIRRLSRYGFDYARKHGKKTVTSATKSNAIIHTMKLWDDVVREVGQEYPEIRLSPVYIDALAAYFINRPESFEVVIASNLFGDILTDLGAGIVGGLGLSPSANLNPEGQFPSMFEPIHGSAPDISGKGIANPVAQIWSAALMLEHNGRPDLSDLVMNGMEAVLAEQEIRTPDLGGKSSTADMGDAIIRAIHAHT
ncbi:tartrate dehydrogenase [Halobacillus kuroshimensis]|uniref:D-malate dehydrogenase (decarboxylating) n=1 Tax=Halobacillus kuroshimensis TaxID=302481 RepID=A0ABS3DR80_9BACI|nr:tartrate dehydrogenase [Halobacillus kuroshimensis]MBN8233821.1 tartrate dehydrogenase [Halobacillus kuroshimensis]